MSYLGIEQRYRKNSNGFELLGPKSKIYNHIFFFKKRITFFSWASVGFFIKCHNVTRHTVQWAPLGK